MLVPLALLVLAVMAATMTANASGKTSPYGGKQWKPPVSVTVFAPRKDDVAGKESKGFFVDLALRYPSLASSGADFQLTGPAAHQNQAPFPGAFGPGVDDGDFESGF